MDEREESLRYYLDELAYLRRMGQEFAHQYPKIAARLEIANGLSTDPHVERLIESFAFLTARLERVGLSLRSARLRLRHIEVGFRGTPLRERLFALISDGQHTGDNRKRR